MIRELVEFIKEELVPMLEKRKDCRHEGEEGHSFCGKCGADIRAVTSWECRLCEILAESSIYPNEKCPDFCTSCGAPKFTFRPIRKKRSKPGA